MQYMYFFVFHYPLLMAFIQIIGALIFHAVREKHPVQFENSADYPLISIIIPCHNEQDCIKETILHLETQDYPDFEIIVINDASTDNTLSILREIQKTSSRLRIINITSNQGKGMGLTLAALASKGEYLICIDADALLDSCAAKKMLWHFINFPRVGAVTGNPRIRNRTTILGKIQVGEFSSIVGMIKRSQRILGKLFTVSGVIAAFRKRALYHVRFWSNDMVTEDIDVTWNLQTHFWDVRYEPGALCWILMPEKLKGLWTQRFRWAQGGGEVLRKYCMVMFSWKQRRLWPVYLEYLLSVLWGYCILFTFIMYLTGLIFDLPSQIQVHGLLPGWTGMILASVCLFQIMTGLIIESKYEPGIYKMFFWVIWYPVIYWIFNAMVSICAFPVALIKAKGKLAVWEHPDRGIND